MGRLIPKNNPKYDHSMDIDLVAASTRAAVVDALVSDMNVKGVEVEGQTPDQLLLSGKSFVGAKNIWITVEFQDEPAGVRVRSFITKAHTAAWIYLFGIGIGPRRVRGISTYEALVSKWRGNLAILGVSRGEAI